MALIENLENQMSVDVLPAEVINYLKIMIRNALQLAIKHDISEKMDKTDGLYYWYQNDTERFIAKKSKEWQQSPLGFVIFWGKERDDVDLEMSQKIWAMDKALVKTFDTFQQVLIYYSMKSYAGNSDKNWINLVVLNDPYGPPGWSEHPLHARAVAYSPKYFEIVQLYRGVLKMGLNYEDHPDTGDECKYILLKRTYIDYRTADSVKRFYFKFPEAENIT